MLSSIRNRLIIVAILVVASIVALIPRDVTIRVRDEEGRMRDTTVKRVPIKQGLDLQGGIHLALEIDQSGGPVADPSGALDRALTVVRSRVDEFGVAEPLIQRIGSDRIVVELAGITDPGRAKQIVQRSAFLEWRITDMENLFRDALPTVDAALLRAGVRLAPGVAGAATPTAVEQLLGGDTAQAAYSIGLRLGIVAGAAASIQTAADQRFNVSGSTTAICMITVTDGSTPTITDTNDIRIRIPSGFDMVWDTGDLTAVIGGDGPVSTTVSYEESGKCLVLNATSDFAAGIAELSGQSTGVA